MEDLRAKAKEATESGQYNKVMVITDGVFSMDGDIAKLPEIVEIAKEFDLITYVDDAHGSGVTGKGKGTVKHFGLEKEIDFQIGTLSKAIGVVGGYVAGKKNLIDWLKVRSRPFLFSTALPPGDVAAITAAVQMIIDSTELHDKLWENGDYLKAGLSKLRLQHRCIRNTNHSMYYRRRKINTRILETTIRRRRLCKIHRLPNRTKRHRPRPQYANSSAYERNAR